MSQKGTMDSQKKFIKSCSNCKYMMPSLLNARFAFAGTLNQFSEKIEPESNWNYHHDKGHELDQYSEECCFGQARS